MCHGIFSFFWTPFQSKFAEGRKLLFEKEIKSVPERTQEAVSSLFLNLMSQLKAQKTSLDAEKI